MGRAPELDTPDCTVELFFRIDGPSERDNPCLVAKRMSSPETRFSIHYSGDLSGLEIWNGAAVAHITPPDGPLRVGRWTQLAVASTPTKLRVYINGVLCPTPVSAPFAQDRKNLPLQVGESSPDGSEAANCTVADLAIYGVALSASDIARHVDACGWGARRRQLDAERKRREAIDARRRAEKLRERQRDRRLTAAGEKRVYRGKHLSAVSFCVGGIGAGTIQMNGSAERAVWQIFNNFSYAVLPHSFFAVRCAPSGESARVRALQTVRCGSFPPFEALEFSGEYPFAWYRFQNPDWPLGTVLTAFSPMIPLRTRESSMPCAIFEIELTNPLNVDVAVSVLAAQQNAVGYRGEGPILENRCGAYGRNRNAITHIGAATALVMESARSRQDPGYGDMTLLALDGDVTGTASWDRMDALYRGFLANGTLDGPLAAGPSAAGSTIDGALCSHARVSAGGSRTLRFALCWSFPNATHGGEIPGWQHKGNRYSGWWSSSQDVARELERELDALTVQTRLFHDTFYSGNLPYWLRDRITSQLAVLRSKTCFWAGDGYFGAWEGCAPQNGCCAG
ncbi:MAG TPA: GH116 family glycosyl-hydrolase, partial [Chthonomonadales bacterium]|nr:GH116 family glycosyl-hydrolase [Chthonomonadales bacterium]